MIIIRLVRHDDPLSAAILINIGGVVAHAEAIVRGGTVIGAFAEGGVQERPLDYDGGKFVTEILVALPATDEMTDKFEHYLRACLGEPYDFTGLADFLHLGSDLHRAHHVFCSALMHDALRGCGYFARPLPVPAHYITPLLLHQELLVRPDSVVIDRESEIFTSHIKQAG
jgi:hypothetical protein